MWFCSASTRILNGDLLSPELRAAFGWNKKLNPRVLADQVIQLATLFAQANDEENLKLLENILVVVPQIYRKLFGLIDDPDHLRFCLSCFRFSCSWHFRVMQETLQGRDWVWVGDGFLPTSKLAFSLPVDARPYMRRLPVELKVVELNEMFSTLPIFLALVGSVFSAWGSLVLHAVGLR
jgi:hypothetical protein